MLLFQVLFCLDGVDGIELMQICQTQIGSFETFDFLLKLLLYIVLLLCQAKISNLELHSRIIDEDISRFDVTVDEALLVDMLESIYELFEEVENHLSVYYVILVVEKFSQSVADAVFHLDHHVQCDEVLLFIDQLVERP